jgi:hypothetical protein
MATFAIGSFLKKARPIATPKKRFIETGADFYKITAADMIQRRTAPKDDALFPFPCKSKAQKKSAGLFIAAYVLLHPSKR